MFGERSILEIGDGDYHAQDYSNWLNWQLDGDGSRVEGRLSNWAKALLVLEDDPDILGEYVAELKEYREQSRNDVPVEKMALTGGLPLV
jgi:hypothetical protein